MWCFMTLASLHAIKRAALEQLLVKFACMCEHFEVIFTTTLLNFPLQLLPGFPLWTLATQSYLISEMALMGRDCLSGDMSQCGTLDCDRFIRGSLTKVCD